MPLYQWLNTLMTDVSLGNRVKSDKFSRCITSQSWYLDHWFAKFMDIFKQFNVYAVTYGLQSTPPVPVDPLTCASTWPASGQCSPLWVLNWVYNGTLLGMDTDGFYRTNPLVYPDFFKAIKKQSTP